MEQGWRDSPRFRLMIVILLSNDDDNDSNNNDNSKDNSSDNKNKQLSFMLK